MDPLAVGLTAVAALGLLLALGVPVAVALGVTGLAGLWLAVDSNFALSVARTLPYGILSSYAWAVLPLFVLMGHFAQAARITEDVFETARLLLARFRGGLYLAVIAGSAVFAAASGSTIVGAAVFTRLALPRMVEAGYSRALSAGCIAASGTFAAMIPPSLTFVIYAMITEQSVGRLLMAGIVPGLISAALYAAAVLVLVRLRPSLAPERETRRIPLSERLGSFSGVWAMFLIVVLVLGGLYAGLFPPSGAGAVGAAGTFLLALARLGPRKGWISESLARSASISCQLFAIILGGLIFSRFLVVTGSVGAIADGLSSLVGSSLGLVVVLSLMYLLLGCFMDTASMMIVTLPIVFPLVGEFGLDPIWFGVVFVKLIEIAVITPPVGLNLFAALSASGRYADYRDIVAGVAPFLVADGAALVLLIAFPGLSTWLPERMF